MFSPRCNKCFKKRLGKNSLELKRCHHIICDECNSEENNENKCPICKRSTKDIDLANDMPSNRDTASYLRDPDEYLSMYKDVSKFQSDQHDLYLKHFYEVEKSMAIKKEKTEAYLKLNAQLIQKIEKEKKRIAELRRYANFYDLGCGDNVSSCSSDAIDNNSIMSRPQTPIFDESSDNDEDISDTILEEFKEFVENQESVENEESVENQESISTQLTDSTEYKRMLQESSEKQQKKIWKRRLSLV